MLKVGVTRLDICFENREETKKRCVSIIEEAAVNGVELLVFPEMTLVGFTMQPEKYSECYKEGKIPDSISFFMKYSRKYNISIAFGYIEESIKIGISGKEEKIFENKLGIVEGDNLILDYIKIHPFSYSGEDKIYSPGDKLSLAKVKDMHIGGYICYDLRFPEIFTAAREKADTFLVIANWPEARKDSWETLLKARAIENQAYVIGVNRIGNGDGLHYVSSSYIFDYLGQDIAKKISETLSVAEIDSNIIKEARSNFPQRNDRKNQLYCAFLS